MLNIRTAFIVALLCLLAGAGYAQSDNISLGSKYYPLLDRLDVKLKHDSILGFTTVKPYSRQKITERIEYIDSLDQAQALPFRLSAVDRYNIRRLLMDNTEWTTRYQDSFRRKKPVLKTFYETPSHMFAVNTVPLTMRVEPLLNLQYGHANDGTGSIYLNTRGILVRGNIGKRIGFYSFLTDNQERDPAYVRDFVNQYHAVPGEGFYKNYGKMGYDYFDVRGGISFRASEYLNFQFAYDKLFIGNGYRSLFLSDFSNNYLFLRMNTRLWKLHYEMIVAETIQSVPQIGREMKPKNYMVMHHLSTQLFPWLNLGLYENIMEDGQKNGLQLSYLNPVIFYRAVESQLGAAGKANIGIDLKSNITRDIQLYSQLLVNEFHIKEIMHYGRGAWVNKQALQVGGKYMDAFKIKNLDLQLEANWIRPFTYMNFDSITNLTHYNQPLAHPLGANVEEYIALARYQPVPKLYLTAKLDYYRKGLDSAGENMGSNIFRTYNNRPRDYGFYIGTGIPVKSVTAALTASYELFENMFLDFSGTYRTYNVQGLPKSNVFFYTFGLRVNMQRREFNF